MFSSFFSPKGDSQSSENFFGDIKVKEPISNSNTISKLNQSTMKIIENASKQVKFSAPILFRNDEKVIFPNSIVTIQGKTGVHKSRFVEAIGAAFLTQLNNKVLGFHASPLKKYRILYVDSERNVNDQFPYALQQTRRLAGYEKTDNHPGLIPISLIDIKRENRLQALKPVLKKMSEDPEEGHLIIILDVVTDCIENFNDPRKSMELIDLMNQMINEFDVTFICIIHENPGHGAKARGHLGTEIINKSTTSIKIGFANDRSDVLKVEFLKCRNTRKHDPFYLIYSDEHKCLIEADEDSIENAKTQNQVKAPRHLVMTKLAELAGRNLSKSKLYEILQTEFDCGERVIDDRIKYICENREEFEDTQGTKYFLSKSTHERKVFYQILKTETPED